MVGFEGFASNASKKDGKQDYCKGCEKDGRTKRRIRSGKIPVPSLCTSLIKREDVFRVCLSCREILPSTKFGLHKKRKRGERIRSQCKECEARKGAVYRLVKNKGKSKSKPPKKTRQEVLEAKKENRLAHKEEISEYNRVYSKEHRREILGKHRVREKERKLSDPIYSLRGTLRSRIQKVYRGRGKPARSKELIGGTFQEAYRFLRTTFWPGMKDGNRGGENGWHIDHRVPVSAVDITDPQMCKLVFHYTNTQALWAKDNLCKNDFIPTFLVQPVPFCGMMVGVALNEKNEVEIKCFV
jgi:hypothetical protein